MHETPHPVLPAAVDRIRNQWDKRPRFAIILGTGAGALAERIDVETVVPYADIPGFPRSTAVGHKGQWVCGTLAGQPILAMQGRLHLYEGYSLDQVRLPIDVMAELGVSTLFVSNAAGGVNPRYRSGELMVIQSHIDLMFRSWPGRAVAGRPTERADVYDRALVDRALAFARRGDFVLQRGVYAALMGPNYETRAEYRFLRRIGADVVGMSTVPEVIFASQHRMRVLGFSIVANVANPDSLEPTSGQEVVDAAAVAAPRLCDLVMDAMANESR